MPSSTSSSDARAGAGRAWPGVILLLVLAELAVRAWQPDGTVPYELGGREYYTLGPELQAFGARQVSIVGDSRSREAILAPVLAIAWKESLAVANYSLSAASAEEVNVVVARLLRASPRPRLIVYGVTPRQLSVPREGLTPYSQYTWLLRDWWAARRVRGRQIDRYLPQVIRNELSEHIRLFRLRPEISDAMHAAISRHNVRYMLRLILQRHGWYPLTPLRGSMPLWKLTLLRDYSRPLTRDDVRKYLGDQHREPEWPHTYQETFAAMLAQACRAAGVPLVFAEVPGAPVLLQELPPRTYPGFYEVFDVLSAYYQVPFIRMKDLGREFSQQDFSEMSHMNYPGARKYSLALAAKLEPFLPPR